MVLTTDTVHERIQRTVEETTAGGCQKLSFLAMGTHCHVTFATTSAAAAKEYKRATLRWVATFEARYSRFLPDSLISQINAAAGHHWVPIDPDTERLLTICDHMVNFTHRAFDPTALPLIKLWNWKTTPTIIPDDATIQTTRRLVGWHNVQRQPGHIYLTHTGMGLDLGGIGKEYAVDCVAQLAVAHGIQNVLVDFGRDIQALGQPPDKPAWHVGLEDPPNPGTTWNGVAARNLAVATSGDLHRCFEINGRRYGHILDPRTGYPVGNGCRSVSIIAPSCTLAGVLSTTAFILGPDEGLRLIESCPGAEGCVITETQTLETRRFRTHVTK